MEPSFGAATVEIAAEFFSAEKYSDSGGSKNFEGGSGRQFISSVLIYSKFAQRKYAFYTKKTRLFGKKLSQWGAAAPTAPLNPPLYSDMRIHLVTWCLEIAEKISYT